MDNIDLKLQGDKLIATGKAGTTWVLRASVTDENGNPVDLSDKVVASHVRPKHGAPVVACFEVSVNVGDITMIMSTEQTRALGGDTTKRYVWDVKVFDEGGNTVDVLWDGVIYVVPEVTASSQCPL